MSGRLRIILIGLILFAGIFVLSFVMILTSRKAETTEANKNDHMENETEQVAKKEAKKDHTTHKKPKPLVIDLPEMTDSAQTEGEADQTSQQNNNPGKESLVDDGKDRGKAPAEKEKKESAGPTSDMQHIRELAENLINTEYRAGGTVSICVARMKDEGVAATGGQRMRAASLIKLYVAGCVYENYTHAAQYEGYLGETEELIGRMIMVSDNTSCNTLVSRLGDGSAENGFHLINQYCSSHGFADTHMGRFMLASNENDDNYTSPRDCCSVLKMFYAGQLAGSENILNYMNRQERRGKIPAGIPAGVTVGNKTGELADVENDAAVIYAGDHPYVMCVMTENLADPGAARQFIAGTAGKIYEAMR